MKLTVGKRLAVFICAICGLSSSYAGPGDPPAPASIADLLRSVQIDPRDVGLRDSELALMVGRGPRSELAHLLMTEPLRADLFASVLGQELPEAAAGHPVELLGAISRFTGPAVRRGLVGDPLERHKQTATQPGALREALRDLWFGVPEELPALDDVPAEVQEAATVLLRAARQAEPWVRPAQRLLRDDDRGLFWPELQCRVRERIRSAAEQEERDRNPDADFERAYKRCVAEFDVAAVMVAAQDLAFAAEFARTKLAPLAANSAKDGDEAATRPAPRFDIRFYSARGWVVLADGRDHEHAFDDNVLLLIDLGGNDTYASPVGANTRAQKPISIALDLAGNDTYRAVPGTVGSFGAGLFGIGLLLDAAGDDTYEGDRWSQGAGHFGAGILIDAAGDDVYRGVQNVQASAIAGYGVLIDRGGRDRYETFTDSQASAGPNAAAVLLDLAGDDRYTANDTEIRFPSAQNPQHNNSMAQGAASGWRQDYFDGFSLGGGVAVLVDAAGDDEYGCGLFGQGAGYWYGAGLLLDLGGRDRYTGHWYVQGAAAHCAVGVLCDRGGHDEYTANQNMSQGAGHDLSVGVLVDDAGDDVYRGSTLGLGASNAAGIGLLLDKGGDDTYLTPAEACLGWANPDEGYREVFRAYGLFFDLGGRDHYGPRSEGGPARRGPGDGRTWSAPPDIDPAGPFRFGWGFDRP